MILVSFAIGGLLGDAFIHLLPESFEKISSKTAVSIFSIAGILLFFTLERILRWRHCHEIDCQEPKDEDHHVVTLSLVGDTVHNMIDGMIIAASFFVSQPVGIATTLAVILHEIPQELGHFGILIHHGLSVKKAIFYNLFSALASVIGVLLTYFMGNYIGYVSIYLLPITAGGFIYLASSDLIPELHRHNPKTTESILQLFCIILGVSLMSLLTLIE